MAFRQQQLQQDVREYMSGIMTAESHHEMSDPGCFEGGGPVFREQLQHMGADGCIALSWPESRGGKNWDPVGMALT